MIKLIVFIVIALLVLSFFGISLRTLVLSPTAQQNFQFVLQLLSQGWNWLVGWFNGLFTSVQHMF